MAEALANHILLYLQVLVDEVGTIVEVGHDASHMGGSKHHSLRAFIVEERSHGHGVEQVKFLVGSAHKAVVTPLLKIVPDGRPHQSTMSCHINFCVFV